MILDIKKILIDRPEILADKIKIRSLLGDSVEGDSAIVNRLMKVYEIGILDAFLEGKTDTLQKSNMVNKLIHQQDMIEERARWAVDTWFSILSPHVLESYRSYLKEKEKIKVETNPVFKKEYIYEGGVEAEPLSKGYDPEDFQRFVNPMHLKSSGTIIPCGVGNTDNGFILHGLRPTDASRHPVGPVLAVIYNFLIRNTKMTDEDIPNCIKNYEGRYDTDYRMIFRYEIIIISAIRAGWMVDSILNIQPLDYINEFQLALKVINTYIALFCRLAGQKPFEVKMTKNAKHKASLKSSKADVYVTENKEYTVARELCFAQKINYHLNKDNRNDLEYLLAEISPFTSFKEGQFESVCSMLNSKEHAVCIMPTGSGKSLIYYYVSILQPLPVFVISPTDILIRDQIRNLRKFHKFDNVAHLQIAEKFNFEHMELCNSLIYLTPATFQSRNLFVRFRHLNEDKLVSNVVLDEVHCLSNWGHDFRPEYLMLSKNLNKYLDRTSFLGFTATANYTVVEDIQKQLKIPQENFYSPIEFEKYNASYHYYKYDITEEMYEAVSDIANKIVNAGERAIVFTKNDDVSAKVADMIGYEADVFLSSNSQAYYQFADGSCKILVTSEELGVGINFSNVTNIIHFGMPISKNEYVQEVGRAGRGEEHIHSYVLFLDPSENNVNPLLIKREAEINHMAQILTKMNNDYTDVYHKLNMNADTSDVLMERLLDIYGDLRQRARALYVIPYDIDTIEETKQYLYMLYASGYISDWYSYKGLDDKKQIEIMIDVSATNHQYYGKEENMVARMRKRSTDYFVFMGNDRKSIAKVARAKSAEEVIRVYVDWYYEKYLYHHKEEFLDMFDFILTNIDGNIDKITEDIKEYFILPFVNIKMTEDYYIRLSIEDISKKIISGVGKTTLINIERINSNRYSYKLDYMLFLGNWRMVSRFDVGRLERFWNKMSYEEQEIVQESLLVMYKQCEDRAKWEFLSYLGVNKSFKNLSIDGVVELMYKDGYRDSIYYGLLSKKLNQKFIKV